MNFNISPDLFIGSQELNRFQKLLSDQGYKRLFLKDSISFGLFNNSKDGNFDNFKVSQGTNSGTIKHNEGFAIDSDGSVIYRAANDNISLIDNNSWYWIKIAHQYDTRELGLCTINSSGTLSGDSSTEFLTTLRGAPNNAVKTAFPDSVLNTGEYEVVEVIDDHTALLSGDFSSESSLRYSVVGAFTPGISVPTDNKYPFQYDGCTMTLVAETVSNTPPTLVEDSEFVIARVKRNGVAITIQDKRSVNIYKSKDGFSLLDFNISDNPLIGIESIKFDSDQSTRDKNKVYVGFGFRSSNWTIDSSTNRLTLIAGNGGKFKSTSYFTDGDFDGWRVYTKDGSYKIVQQSSLSATQINLTLDSLDPDDFLDTTQEIHVVPNCEEIELIFTADPDDSVDLVDYRISFPINSGIAIVSLLVYKTVSCDYNVKYRYKNFQSYSSETAIPSDLVSGYYTEASFDDDGNLTGSTKQTYTSSATDGFITLTQAANAYKNIIDGLSTGQTLGVEYVSLNTTTDPVIRFVTGTRREHVVITNDSVIDVGDSDFGSAYVLTADAFFDLRTDVPSSLANGNFFLIQLRGEYTIGAFSISIVENYVNSGDTGDLLYELTQADLDQATVDNLIFKCSYDGTRWFVHKFISNSGTEVTSSRTISTTSPLTGGGNLSANRTLAINDAAADGSTKGAAAFNASDFNATSGVVSLDYTNGQAATAGQKGYLTASDWSTFNAKASAARLITAGSGLSGGGDLSADRTIDVNVDNSTLEISADTVRIKDLGVTGAKIAAAAVDENKLAASVAGNGLSGGAGSALAVNVDSSSVEISGDTVRLPNGYKAVQSPDAVQLYTKVVQIGDWNMNFSAAGSSLKSVAHGLGNFKKIRSARAVIRSDDDAVYGFLDFPFGTDQISGGIYSFDATNINLSCSTPFNSAVYDSTSYNRGYITIMYEA